MKKVQSFAATTAAILIILGGTTVYAYNASSVTVGDSMYSLKVAAERARVSLAGDGIDRVKAQLNNAERRVAEARYLAASGSVKPIQTVFIKTAFAQDSAVEVQTNLSETLDAAVTITEEAIATAETITEPSEAEEALISIEESQEVQKEELNEIAAVVDLKDVSATTAVSDALAATEENHTAIVAAQEVLSSEVDSGETEVEVKVETVTEKKQKNKLTLEEINALQASYVETKTAMTASLTEAGVSAEDAARLNEKIFAMEAKVAAAIEGGNYQQAKGLIKASIALQNNAKHFIKKVEVEEKREELKKETEKKVKEIRIEHKKKLDELKQLRKEIGKEMKNFKGSPAERRQKIEELRNEILKASASAETDLNDSEEAASSDEDSDDEDDDDEDDNDEDDENDREDDEDDETDETDETED